MAGAVILRVAKPEDAGSIAAIYAPYVRDSVISFETEPPDEQEMGRRIRVTLETHPWLVAALDGEVVGYAYASQHRARLAYRWGCDVAVYLTPGARGKGIGSALYTELLAILRRQGFRHAFGGIALPNAASIALHERHGFRHIGTYSHVGYKLGAWHDVGWWQCRLASTAAAPEEIIPFPDLGG
jgi:L-amino acid N-acyltransferase YncA